MDGMKQRFERARVLVVGDAMLDRYWFGAVERISPEAPVPVVRIDREGGAARRRRQRGPQRQGRWAPAPRCSRSWATTNRRAGCDACSPTQGIVSLPRQRSEAQHDREAARHRPLPATDPRRLREPARPRGAGAHAERLRAHAARARRVLFSDYGKGGLTHIPRHDRDGARRRQARARRSQGQRLRPLSRAPPSSLRTATSSRR